LALDFPRIYAISDNTKAARRVLTNFLGPLSFTLSFTCAARVKKLDVGYFYAADVIKARILWERAFIFFRCRQIDGASQVSILDKNPVTPHFLLIARSA
tara:strand:+ start:4363 stop:4659 length:297 start_codon:yes stop_codon:yes gene_type:complete